MSVLIKSIEMPKKCKQCWFFGSDSARVGYCYLLKGKLPLPDGVPQDCPLIEVPTTHGDLIDREALIKAFHAWFDDDEVHAFEKDAYWHHGVVMKIINDALTVIENEKS